MDQRQLTGFIEQVFSRWDEPPLAYARDLGFEPHPDKGHHRSAR